jgi:hypothetical protein
MQDGELSGSGIYGGKGGSGKRKRSKPRGNGNMPIGESPQQPQQRIGKVDASLGGGSGVRAAERVRKPRGFEKEVEEEALGGKVDGVEGGEEGNEEEFGEIVEVDMEEDQGNVGGSPGLGGGKRGEFVVKDDGDFTVEEEEDVEDVSVSGIKHKISHGKRAGGSGRASPGKGAGCAPAVARTGRAELKVEGDGKGEGARAAIPVGLRQCQVAIKRWGQNPI